MSPVVDYTPRFPDPENRPGIGLIGCGGVARGAHLTAYQKYGLNVVGVFDPDPKAIDDARAKFGVAPLPSAEAVLDHPDVGVVDIPTHPDVRVPIIKQALAAGKHVLSQKPLALDVASAVECVRFAREKGRLLAVNQNGRWAPPWRVATKLVEDGVIGEVIAVTHLFEMNFGWTVGSWFEKTIHPIVYDYGVHWIDITRCWMTRKSIRSVKAREFRLPNQAEKSAIPWGATVEFDYADGATAMIRMVGAANTKRNGHPFFIHGTKGNVRGSCLGNDFVELEVDGNVLRYQLEGSWAPDGWAGTMGELMCAIDEGREPYHSAAHNLLSLQMTLAACESIDKDGTKVAIEEVTL